MTIEYCTYSTWFHVRINDPSCTWSLLTSHIKYQFNTMRILTKTYIDMLTNFSKTMFSLNILYNTNYHNYTNVHYSTCNRAFKFFDAAKVTKSSTLFSS